MSRVLTLFLCAALALSMQAKAFTLVIDAGHGGHDAGAVGKKGKEKNINLSVALAFGRLVEQNCPNVKVIYTRKTDVFVTLHERAAIANRNKANLFISIHTNAVGGGRIVRGMETYTLGMHRAADNLEVAKRENNVILFEENYEQHYEGFDPNSSESYIMFELMQDVNMAQSVDLARFVQQRATVTSGRKNLGVKQAGFLVLRETSMPSCLIELGFISTPDEETYLLSSAGTEAYARGIYQAFLDYLNKYNTSTEITKTTDNSQLSDSNSQLIYRVQIKASPNKLKTSTLNSQLSTLNYNVEYYQEGGMYKYTVGATANYDEALQLRAQVVKNFPDAFIVTFKDGKRIK